MQDAVNSYVKAHKHTIHSEIDLLWIIATFAKKYQIGNCGEQSAVAYCYLKDVKHVRKVERLAIVQGDHSFIVIGRTHKSDIENPQTWGKAAIVCDP